MKKRILALVCTLALVFTVTLLPIASASADTVAGPASLGITKYLESYDESKATDPAFTNAVATALSEIRNEGVNASSNAIQKALAVQNYLAKTVQYDSSYYSGQAIDASFSAYGALVNHSAVCDGYTDAYKVLMNALGVPTIGVRSTKASTSHTWNMVNLNGKWYHVDPTWDITGSTNKYFVKSDSYMQSLGDTDHDQWDSFGFNSYGYPTGGAIPAANDMTYDSTDFSNMQVSDLASYMNATTATMSLDTTSIYNGLVGHKYTFAVRTNIGEMAFATSTNPNVQVSAPVYTSGKQLYTISFKASCTATINVTSASGLTASFPVVVKAGKEEFTCDTRGTLKIKEYGKYTFLITSNKVPKVATGSGLVNTVAYHKVGNRYYYTIQAYGDPGTTVGIYINDSSVPTFIAKIV